jgi:hypothetical protein
MLFLSEFTDIKSFTVAGLSFYSSKSVLESLGLDLKAGNGVGGLVEIPAFALPSLTNPLSNFYSSVTCSFIYG